MNKENAETVYIPLKIEDATSTIGYVPKKIKISTRYAKNIINSDYFAFDYGCLNHIEKPHNDYDIKNKNGER